MRARRPSGIRRLPCSAQSIGTVLVKYSAGFIFCSGKYRREARLLKTAMPSAPSPAFSRAKEAARRPQIRIFVLRKEVAQKAASRARLRKKALLFPREGDSCAQRAVKFTPRPLMILRFRTAESLRRPANAATGNLDEIF